MLPCLELSFAPMTENCYLDAEECWSQMVNGIKGHVPGLPNGSALAAKTFVEQYMMGEMRTV